jgi:hypothetical protein
MEGADQLIKLYLKYQRKIEEAQRKYKRILLEYDKLLEVSVAERTGKDFYKIQRIAVCKKNPRCTTDANTNPPDFKLVHIPYKNSTVHHRPQGAPENQIGIARIVMCPEGGCDIGFTFSRDPECTCERENLH